MKFLTSELEALQKMANGINVPLATLLAIIEVESNGILGATINGRFEPIIRYEGHYFDKLCKAEMRAPARKAGVSAPTAGTIKNPSKQIDRWKLVQKAATFDPSAAYMSCSYGVGQVMGSHWKDLGFKSISEFLKKVRSGLIGQVEVMVRFIKKNNLIAALQNLDWSAFARGYNGPAYRKNQYDTKMSVAYKRHGGIGTISASRNGYLRLGSKGAGVRDLQAMLKLAGYDVSVDGDFGNATDKAVKAFQKSNRLVADGIVGPKTQTALTKVRDTAPSDAGQEPITKIEEVKQGGLVAGGTLLGVGVAKGEINNAIEQISGFSYLAPLADFLQAAVGVLTVVAIVGGVLYAGYGYWKSRQNFTGTKTTDDDPIELEDVSVVIPEEITV